MQPVGSFMNKAQKQFTRICKEFMKEDQAALNRMKKCDYIYTQYNAYIHTHITHNMEGKH